MRRTFLSVICSLCFFTYSYSADAMPLRDADAFKEGDHLAMYDSTTGLSWLDWGITNWTTGVAQTLHDLRKDPKYYHWRVPTTLEVLNLIPQLIPDAAGNSAMGAAITDIWGFNIDYNDGLHDYVSFGFFRSPNGWGTLDVVYDLGDEKFWVSFDSESERDVPEWSSVVGDVWSTLLVRDGAKVLKAVEPSAVMSFLTGLLGIFVVRFFTFLRRK